MFRSADCTVSGRKVNNISSSSKTKPKSDGIHNEILQTYGKEEEPRACNEQHERPDKSGKDHEQVEANHTSAADALKCDVRILDNHHGVLSHVGEHGGAEVQFVQNVRNDQREPVQDTEHGHAWSSKHKVVDVTSAQIRKKGGDVLQLGIGLGVGWPGVTHACGEIRVGEIVITFHVVCHRDPP